MYKSHNFATLTHISTSKRYETSIFGAKFAKFCVHHFKAGL
jgi:hypothetical protein